MLYLINISLMKNQEWNGKVKVLVSKPNFNPFQTLFKSIAEGAGESDQK